MIYTLVGFAVASNLSLAEIIETQDYSLAAAAPALGDYGLWFTVAIAMIATAGGLLASIFAVSRMLAMLTKMKLVPHRHFGMPEASRSTRSSTPWCWAWLSRHCLICHVLQRLGLFLSNYGYCHSLGCSAISSSRHKSGNMGTGSSHIS